MVTVKRITSMLVAFVAFVSMSFLGTSPAKAAVKGFSPRIGSCWFYHQAATLGSGWSTYIRASNSGCLHIRARRSGNTSWIKVSNPPTGGSIYLPQGNNTWVDFEGKSEILVNGIDTWRVRCYISPGDWYNAASISCSGAGYNT